MKSRFLTCQFILTFYVVFYRSDLGFCGALHIAASNGDVAYANAALANGADVNEKDQFGNTPLHIAASYDAKQIASLLIEKGADINAKDRLGNTPLGTAADNNATNVALLLIEEGADVNGKGRMSETPLCIAADRDYRKLAELLIGKGADINLRSGFGWTPLEFAAEQNATNVASLLIEKGADVNSRDRSGDVPLRHAVSTDHRNVAQLLIEKGADVNARDRNGVTPLFAAVYHNATNIALFLIENGADINVRNVSGETPLEIAEKQNSEYAATLRQAALTRHEAAGNEEVSGDASAKDGKLREAFNHYMSAMTSRVNGPDLNTTANIRIKITGVVRKLDPPPVVPEEAKRHNARGGGLVQVARNPEDFAAAANEFQQARDLAPWWTDAYFNEAVARDKASQYQVSLDIFKLYLAFNPVEADAQAAREKIYAVEAEKELAQKHAADDAAKAQAAATAQEAARALDQALVGTWYGTYTGGIIYAYRDQEAPFITITGSAGTYSATMAMANQSHTLNDNSDTFYWNYSLSDFQIVGSDVKFQVAKAEHLLSGRGLDKTYHYSFDLRLSDDKKRLTGTGFLQEHHYSNNGYVQVEFYRHE